MLTEEQLAAVLDAVANVERLILVGDPRQLPPIGAGRPFVDIVQFLRGSAAEPFPRVGPSYTELTVRRRQTGDERTTSRSPSGSAARPSRAGRRGLGRHLCGAPSETVRFEQWNNASDVYPLAGAGAR